jgi:hypothetical protein
MSTSPEISTLPTNLMLEIVARSKQHVLVRCVVACRILRHDILSTSFISMCTDNNNFFSLVYAATLTATFFHHGHLFPFFSNSAASLIGQYSIVTSRRGLVLLRRVNIKNPTQSCTHIANPTDGLTCACTTV